MKVERMEKRLNDIGFDVRPGSAEYFDKGEKIPAWVVIDTLDENDGNFDDIVAAHGENKDVLIREIFKAMFD